ncbi:hypothetical protein [Mycobacteroides abscessus]|uniref:hypothetical protein n=1 Tax=Mycobacteroides abscessus TaxID=36809 RepID=UPI0009A5CBF8|nr:hypothetical protein [Mycobacteroides abscessus]SKO29342.1 Uncharacterised protein [Mycobacteroides abscessus subsp. massiliense]
MSTVHPPLTAEDFETQYDAEHRYMFIQDEGGDMLYTYGHDRDDEFARQAREFALEIEDLDKEDADRLTADVVLHLWAVTTHPKPEWRFTWENVYVTTDGSFPVSVIFR